MPAAHSGEAGCRVGTARWTRPSGRGEPAIRPVGGESGCRERLRVGTLPPVSQLLSEIDECADAGARRAGGGEGRSLFLPGGAGDVEMRPGAVVDELA